MLNYRQEAESKQEVEHGYKYSKTAPNETVPPIRPHILNLSPSAPLSGDCVRMPETVGDISHSNHLI